MSKRVKITRSLIALSLAAVAFASVTAFTLSWFLGPNINTEDDNYLNGDIGLRNYFFSGDGSEQKPYEIVSPIHYYNLTRLQNLGVFPQKTYFQVGHVFDIDGVPTLRCIDHYDASGEPVYTEYLDMGSFSSTSRLMPIGNEGTPFFGEFNGNALPIKNLKIYGNPEDIGMFGYVAHQGVIKNLLLDNTEIISLGYNNDSEADDYKLFSADIDDIFHSASYLATDTSLDLYDYDTGYYQRNNLKKLNGATGTVLTDINSSGHLYENTRIYNGYFKPTFPNVENDPFTYSVLSSSPLIKPVGDLVMEGSSIDDLIMDLNPLYESTSFNSGKNTQVNAKIFLVASVTVDGHLFSRVIQSYTIEFYSNSHTYDEGQYSSAIFCDYVDQGDETDKNTGYHHGNNIGIIAGHVDGSLKDCYVYDSRFRFNETGYHPIASETQIGLVGEIGTNVFNTIDPDYGLVVNGDIGVMNFSKIYGMIRSDMTYPHTVMAGQRTPTGESNVRNYISYKDFVNHETIDNFKDYLRYYDGQEDELITYTDRDTSPGSSSPVWHSYDIPQNIPSSFNSVDFLWNKVIQDDDEVDRGLGVFKIVSSYNADAKTHPYGEYMANNLGDCRIVNGSPKTKVYFSTAEYDHTKKGYAGWSNDLQPLRATTIPSYSDILSYNYPFTRDYNYLFELDLSKMDKAKGNNYMYNTDSPFLTNYLSSILIDKNGKPVTPGSQRFGFMFRSSDNEVLSSLSSYMPVDKPSDTKQEFIDPDTGETKYYPAKSIVFRIENEHGANVSVVANNDDVTIYGYDPNTPTGNLTPMYTMKSNNVGGTDSLRYFTYDVETGETGTETVSYGNSMSDSGALYAHIFRLPPGDYVIGANSNKANIYFLAVQGQTEGTIGSNDIISIDDEIQDIDFLLEPPTHAAFAENLNKAMFTYSGLFNTSSGVVDMDVIVVDDKKYMRILFNTSPTYVTYVLTYARSTEHKYYINESLIDEVNYTYEV